MSDFQSGFRKQHSTTKAALKVLNDFIESVDNKEHCAALFIDLSKAFDTVDHTILIQRLMDIGLSKHTIGWFNNYLSNRTQCVQAEGFISGSLNVTKGVPQWSVLGPLLFTIYINNIDHNVHNVKFHYYADDTVIYSSASTPNQALSQLQFAFDIVQRNLFELKLVLNVDKTKFMLFSKSKPISKNNLLPITTSQGSEIEFVSQYRYLGILIDDALSFGPHVEQLVKRLKVKLGFYFRNKSCLSFEAKKRLVEATFMSVLDYGDVIYIYACIFTMFTCY